MRVVAAVAAVLITAPVLAQSEGSTRDQAGHIISQPGRDVGLIKTKIPPVLQRAEAAPYAEPPGGCAAITSAMADLDDALGPDYGHATTRRGSRVGTIARMGGQAAVDSLIPFRGVVREVSGAAAADRRLSAAVRAGYARRGYLHGVALARHCSAG